MRSGLPRAVVQRRPVQHCKAMFLQLKKEKRKKNFKLKKNKNHRSVSGRRVTAYTDLRDLLSRLKLRK